MYSAIVLLTLIGFSQNKPALSPNQSSTPDKIRLDFQAKPWADVVKWLANLLDLTVQMDFMPPGKFTCQEPRTFTKDELFDFLHGLLLDRGITMLRRDKLLIVLLLAENQHAEYLNHVAADELDRLPKSELVSTTFKLHSLAANAAAHDLLPSLSARGKLVGIKSSNRLIATDRVDALLGLRQILEEVDPPDEAKSAAVKIFALKHSSARYVAVMLRELTGGTLAEPVNPIAELTNFKKLGQQLGNRQMLESFVPGMSFKGVVADAPRDPRATHLTYNEYKNSVMISAEPEVLALAAKVVEGMDRPESKIDGEEFVYRSYRVDSGKGKELSKSLARLFSAFSGFRIDATETALVVRATPKQHDQIKQILTQAQTAASTLAVFSVGERDAAAVKKQLDRLFKGDGVNAPNLIADRPGKNLIVKGTEGQIAQVRMILLGLGAPIR